MSRLPLGAVVALLTAASAAAQPAADAGPQTPLDLARGLRDAGQADLALEYLDGLAKKPGVPDAVKAELPMERAKCLVEQADDEPDEGAKANRVDEARKAFTDFLAADPNHPRAAEAYLALARLASLDAKAKLAKARRIDLPADGAGRDDAANRQRAEAVAARPLFDEAARRFDDAARRLDAQAEKAPAGAARRELDRARFDARLDAAANLLARAETFLHPTADEKAERAKAVDQARAAFAFLTNPNAAAPPRVQWVARAWVAECYHEMDQPPKGDEELNRVLAATGPDADEGKRVARFFRLRRKFGEAVNAKTAKAFEEPEKLARDWLREYGGNRRAAAEAVAVRWYLGYTLQALGDSQLPPPPKTPPKAGTPEPPVPAGAKLRYAEAEKLYRQVAQSDTEYAPRAARQRLVVVRRLLGDASQPPAAYATFEEAQLASLIHLGKIAELEKAGGADAEVKDRRQQVVALLERARELAGPADNPADVADAALRLVVYYAQTGRPDRAAVLGEAVARAARPGTRPATAGALAVNAYAAALAQTGIDPQKIGDARKADRDRAVRLARFLDERFPADPATDRVRHRLAILLYEDGKGADALQSLVKVRPGYDELAAARLFEGALASQLLAPKDSPVPEGQRRAVFQQVVRDLQALPRPPADAPADDAREYLSARCRLALLYLLQPRLDPDAEKAEGGYTTAGKLAGEALALLPTYPSLRRPATTDPTATGLELMLLAEDARTRAAYLAGQALFLQSKYDEAYSAIGLILTEMKAKGPYGEVVRKAAGGPAPAPKGDPAPKAPEGKKETEPKKDAEPKGDGDAEPKADDPAGAMPADADPDTAARGRAAKLAEGVDKLRRDLILLAVKIRVKQGRAEQGVEQLDLLRAYGGGLDANPAALRQLAGDLGAQVQALRKAGKADEANALAGAFGKLLDGVAASPTLPAATRLLVGQALNLIGEYGKAEAVLKAVPAPADPGLLRKPLAELNDEQRRQVQDYRRAVLELAKALRLGKKYAEAEALLQAAVGPPGQPGWGATLADFRRELAHLNEARAADAADPGAAKTFWGEALKEWGTVAAAARQQYTAAGQIPKGGKQPDNAAVQRTKNAFYDAFFESNRCVVQANQQLLKGNPKLQGTYDNVGKKFVEVEKAAGNDLTAEVKGRYADFLAAQPELRKAYEAAGGKLFLEQPPPGM